MLFRSPHLFEPIDPGFAARVQRGDLVVAGADFGCGKPHIQGFIAMAALGMGVLCGSMPYKAMRGAISKGLPVLTGCGEPGDWVADGAHVNSVGASRPEWRELDDAFVRRARVFVDSRAGAQVESGDVMAAGRIDAEIGEVVLGRHGGRATTGEVTWFKSLGMAVEDVVAADLVLRATS